MNINAFLVNQVWENINFDIFSSCWQQKQTNVIYHCLVLSRLAVSKHLFLIVVIKSSHGSHDEKHNGRFWHFICF